MKIIENENVVMIDVDDTLLMWDSPLEPGEHKIKLQYADGEVYLTPHNYHVALIKTYRERGYLTVVWSANGYRHALRAVEALKLKPFVDIIMSKPSKYMDDSTADTVLGPRVYCKDFLSK